MRGTNEPRDQFRIVLKSEDHIKTIYTSSNEMQQEHVMGSQQKSVCTEIIVYNIVLECQTVTSKSIKFLPSLVNTLNERVQTDQVVAESLRGNDEQILVYHCRGLP